MKANNKANSIAAIAELCGVSAMTVSRALRGSVQVKEETRRKILEAAERIGYIRRGRLGRPATSGNEPRGVIEVIIGYRKQMPMFFSELLAAIESGLCERDFDCMLRTCNGEYDSFNRLCGILGQSSVQGTMIVGEFNAEQFNAMFELRPGCLVVDNPGSSSMSSSYDSICFDDIEAARLAVKYLLDAGKRRIVMIKGRAEHYFSREMEQGYRDALALAGVDFDKKLVLIADFTADGACDALSEAIGHGLKFDAVFTNDEMACGVYRALSDAGLKSPDDVLVCGCDGLPVAKQLFPPLPTVVLDYREMGELAVEYLLDDMEKRKSPRRIRLVPFLDSKAD
jgi:LacI family transcriptional regulator